MLSSAKIKYHILHGALNFQRKLDAPWFRENGLMNVFFQLWKKVDIKLNSYIRLTQLCLSPDVVTLVNCHIAVDTGHTHVMLQGGWLCCVICHHDEYFTFTDTDGDTLLHRVCSAGNEKLARVLLKHRANPNSLNNLQQSPILLAAKTGQVCSVTNKQL